MAAISRLVGACCIVSALGVSAALAAGATADPQAANAGPNASGALPGDDALTCEQIYAQGMAESQQDQQARAARNEQMRAQRNATAAMMTGAMLTGGLGGTGQMAQRSAENQADQTMALLGAPQTNPRMDHLKQLWAQKHCVKK